MEKTIKIMIFAIAIMVIVAGVSAVGLVSFRENQRMSEQQLNSMRNDLIQAQNQLEAEKLAKDKLDTQLEDLQTSVDIVRQQNEELKRLQQEIETKAAEDSELTFEEILRDISKLTLGNCYEVLRYAEDIEDDIENDIEDLEEDLDKLQERLQEKLEDLDEAEANGDDDDIRTAIKRVDYAQDKVDDKEEEIEDLEDERNSMKRLRVRAKYQCNRLEREF